jgi:hypothetical protein
MDYGFLTMTDLISTADGEDGLPNVGRHGSSACLKIALKDAFSVTHMHTCHNNKIPLRGKDSNQDSFPRRGFLSEERSLDLIQIKIQIKIP